MNLLDVITPDEAVGLLKKEISNILTIEQIPIDKSLGKVAAKDIYAVVDLPEFNKSMLDGYAVNSKDTAGSSSTIPVMLDLVGEVKIGQAPTFNIEPGQAAYIPTGGMLPSGADGVVMVEYSNIIGSKVALEKPISSYEGVLPIGEDIKKGQHIVNIGETINSATIGLLASQGIKTIDVYKDLTMSVISTGDELIKPTKSPEMGQVRDINSYTIRALGEKLGINTVFTTIIPDNKESFITAAKKEDSSDIVVISGGSSKGKDDYTLPAFEDIGEVLFHGLAMRPGKPTLAARSQDTLFIGLPGHPMAAILVWELVVAKALCLARNEAPNLTTYGYLTTNLNGTPGRDTIVPVKLRRQDKFYSVEPIYGTSATISTLSGADGYIIIPRMNEGVDQGELVKVNLFKGGIL